MQTSQAPPPLPWRWPEQPDRTPVPSVGGLQLDSDNDLIMPVYVISRAIKAVQTTWTVKDTSVVAVAVPAMTAVAVAVQ